METLVSIKTDTANKTVTINEATGGKPEHAVYSARIEDGNLILINSETDQITLPSDKTSGIFTMELMTIADNASLAVGRGYQLIAQTSFTDNNLVVRVDSITRISFAVENQ